MSRPRTRPEPWPPGIVWCAACGPETDGTDPWIGYGPCGYCAGTRRAPVGRRTHDGDEASFDRYEDVGRWGVEGVRRVWIPHNRLT